MSWIAKIVAKKKKRQIRVRAGAGPEATAPPPRAPEFGFFFVKIVNPLMP